MKPPQPPLPPPMSYQSKEFARLLDSDQDSDEDVDIFNKGAVKPSALKPTKSKSQSKPAPKSKTTSRKASLTVLKDSSPEQSDDDDDDDDDKDLEEEHVQHARNGNRNQRQTKTQKYRRRSIANDEDSEDEQSNESGSQQMDSDEESLSDYDRKYKQQREKQRNDTRNASKSRSRSTTYSKGKPVSKTPTRSTSKPSYIQYPSKKLVVAGAAANTAMPVGSKHIAKRLMHSAQTSPSQPFTVSHPPPHARTARQKASKQPPLPPPPRMSELNDTSKPVSFRSRFSEYYEQFVFALKKVMSIIFWLPLQIMGFLKYLLDHICVMVIVVLIIALSIGPITTILSSLDIKNITKQTLQSLGILPSIKYCDGTMDEINVMEIDDCQPCPEFGVCSNGDLLHCQADRRLIDGECKYDEREIVQILDQMKWYSTLLLSQHVGEYECQQCELYKYVHGIAPENHNVVNTRGLSGNELSAGLAKNLHYSPNSHLYQNTFAKFTRSIQEPNDSLHAKQLRYDRDIGFFSSTPSKPITCYLLVFLQTHCLVLAGCTVLVSVTLFSLIRSRRRRRQKERARQRIEDKKEEVLDLLKNVLMNSNTKWVPVDVIRWKVMGSNAESAEWRKIKRNVEKDALVQPSEQIVDGLQKTCWKLTEAALMAN